MLRGVLATLLVSLFTAGAFAGTLAGKLELPAAPERPPLTTKGFLDRVENPLAPVKPAAPTHQMVVVLFGDEKPVSPPQVVIELRGETFSRKVAAAPAGAEVVIKNVSKAARTLVAPKMRSSSLRGPSIRPVPSRFASTSPTRSTRSATRTRPI